MEKLIKYFGETCKVGCDENCKKAWGISSRPSEKVSDNPDDICWVADDEFGEAPDYPGTYEGGYAKPIWPAEMLNKWCVRECERCVKSKPGEAHKPLLLKDWSNRRYNIAR